MKLIYEGNEYLPVGRNNLEVEGYALSSIAKQGNVINTGSIEAIINNNGLIGTRNFSKTEIHYEYTIPEFVSHASKSLLEMSSDRYMVGGLLNYIGRSPIRYKSEYGFIKDNSNYLCAFVKPADEMNFLLELVTLYYLYWFALTKVKLFKAIGNKNWENTNVVYLSGIKDEHLPAKFLEVMGIFKDIKTLCAHLELELSPTKIFITNELFPSKTTHKALRKAVLDLGKKDEFELVLVDDITSMITTNASNVNKPKLSGDLFTMKQENKEIVTKYQTYVQSLVEDPQKYIKAATYRWDFNTIINNKNTYLHELQRGQSDKLLPFKRFLYESTPSSLLLGKDAQ